MDGQSGELDWDRIADCAFGAGSGIDRQFFLEQYSNLGGSGADSRSK
jgi:hypothetical protein